MGDDSLGYSLGIDTVDPFMTALGALSSFSASLARPSTDLGAVPSTREIHTNALRI